MAKKIYVLADSMVDFKLKREEYVNDPEMDCTGLEFVYLTSADQIPSDQLTHEVWECSKRRQELSKRNINLIGGM